jgi:hypothetical protein
LSEAQWTTSPRRIAGRRGSRGHVATSEGFIRGFIEPMMKEEPAAELLAGARKDTIDQMVVDRSKKFQAIEPLQPTKKYKTPADALAAFHVERQKTIDFGRAAATSAIMQWPIRRRPADAYGWIVSLSAHSERHMLQIEEVKGDAGYPK